MSIYKNTNGAWVISELVGGYLVTKHYYFYSKREAVALFKQKK
jgi:hypothetical protein